LASVSVVSSTDFRANLSSPQNSATSSEEPFSLLLNAVGDVKAEVQRPDAPKAASKRDDAPAKQPKPEADADRQAKRRASDAEKPEGKAQTESTAPVKAATNEDGEEAENDTEDSETAAADALLMLALNEPQQPVATAQAGVDASAEQTAMPATVPVVAQTAVETQTAPVLAAAIADASASAAVETQPAQTPQATAGAKVQFEIAPAATAQTEAEIALPKIDAETISSLLKPLKTAAPAEAQVLTQPGSVNVATATKLEGPAPLEMLNAAIKHVQLALGAETNDQPQDMQKPLISSNAVAPNFAMTAQASTPVQVQTQTVAEVSRAVPMEQLAVEIATRAGKGERRFDIRLDPPELGRIDVRLEIDSKGNTTTKLIVERAETLDMFQRDARGLEKALQNAGLKLDAGGLEFSLRQDTQANQGQQGHAPEMRGRPDLIEAETEIMTEVAVGNASLAAQIRGGVDIRI
jgi:flagellar hook-length control protein FliK